MRETKFRVWDKNNKRMLYLSDDFTKPGCQFLDLHEDGWELINIDSGDKKVVCGQDANTGRDDGELLQYTGLKDNTKWESLSEKEQLDFIEKCGLSKSLNRFERAKRLWGGKEIYESDLVSCWKDGIEENKFVLEVVYAENGFKLKLVDDVYEDFDRYDVIEVVGNIYDEEVEVEK